MYSFFRRRESCAETWRQIFDFIECIRRNNTAKKWRYESNHSYLGRKNSHFVGFQEDRHISAENWRKTLQVVMLTLTPEENRPE
jgi:hypothetical protein